MAEAAAGTAPARADGRRRVLPLAVAACLASSLACRASSKEPAPSATVPSPAKATEAARPWPPLPTTGFLSGRAATLRDAQEGNAVFVAESGGRALGTPLAVDVPQYALLTAAGSGRPVRVIVLQAERAAGTDTIGYRDVETGRKGVAALAEVRLLGRTPPGE